MARYRKHTSNKVIKLTKQQILMIEDQWWNRYNKVFHNINTNRTG